MIDSSTRRLFDCGKCSVKRFVGDNGSVVVLLALCAYYSVVTLDEQHPNTPSAGQQVASAILKQSPEASVVVISRDTAEDRAYTDAVRAAVEGGGGTVLAVVNGAPADARAALEQVGGAFSQVNAIATNHAASE